MEYGAPAAASDSTSTWRTRSRRLERIKAVETAFPGCSRPCSEEVHAVISGIFITPDRAQAVRRGRYMKTHRALVVQAGNPKRINGPNAFGQDRRRAGGDEVRGVPQGAEREFKPRASAVHTAELSGRHGRRGSAIVGRADAVLTQDTSGRVPEAAASRQARDRVPVPGDGLVRDLLPEGRPLGTKMGAAGVAIKR